MSGASCSSINYDAGNKVQSYRLIGHESRLLNKGDFNDDTKDAGEMGVGHTATAFYEVVPVGVKGAVPAVDELKYQENTQSKSQKAENNASDELLTVKLRYKLPNEDKSAKMGIVLVDGRKDNVSEDFHFASSVVMFGQLLRDSDFKVQHLMKMFYLWQRKRWGQTSWDIDENL
jgi:Ca-activated chloride channel family protein